VRKPASRIARDLPETQAIPADVMIRRVDGATGRAEGYYVASAWGESWWGQQQQLGGMHPARQEAQLEAWRLSAIRGGRLLSFQRHRLVEQVLWWEFSIDLTGEDPVDYQRQGKGERRLHDVLARWLDLPAVDALRLARQLILRWHGVKFALTQSETRKLHQRPSSLTPLSKALADRVTYREYEAMPAHLAKPTYQPALNAPVAGDMLTSNPSYITWPAVSLEARKSTKA
jgi:hypothetical protein